MGAPETGASEAAADAGAPPSCAPGGPGMTNCGPGGSGTESCCTSLEVTAGTYFRTYGSDADGGATALADPATVSSFRLDKYLVTVGRFRQFVNAWNAGWLPAAGAGKHTHLSGGKGLAAIGGGFEPGWVTADDVNIAPTSTNFAAEGSYATWTASPGSQENLLINDVNWYESYAFCIWDGGFLPSEAEWEYAAAGGGQQREYPWGSQDPGTANRYAIYGCYYPEGTGICTGFVNFANVGTATVGAGLWGQLDLAGDGWEWSLDWEATYIDPCVDCADLTPASERTARGGGFSGDTSSLLPPVRSGLTPQYRFSDTGFRCARTP
jgi:formylglycine-generating enzyme